MSLPKCPFYGFRWPERRPDLIAVGGNECGIDVDRNGPCRMEAKGCAANYSYCEAAADARVYLTLGSDRIRFFPSGLAEGVPLEAWTNQVMHRAS